LVLLAAATLAMEAFEAPGAALWRNLFLLAGMAIVWGASLRIGGGARDLPIARIRGLAPAIVGIAAIASTGRTLGLPYFADDWQLLDMRGRGSLADAVSILPGEPWFRPIGWIAWWVYHQLSPLDATLGHAVNVALFASTAILVAPALRRMGMPRGIASASAFLFALSPAALETTAWVTNVYALLGTLFSVAAIATLPFGRAGARRVALPCALASLAFLSREDTYLLPILVAATFARFDPRRAIVGIRRAIPFLVCVAIVASARFVAIGDAGAYRDAQSGSSPLMSRALYGPRLALQIELPAAYVLPCRVPPDSDWFRAAFFAIPAAILAFGGASVAARRGLVRGAAIVGIGLAPTASLLPIGPELLTARWIYAPSIGIALAVASVLAGGRVAAAGRALRWVPILGFACLEIFAANRNYPAWEASGEILRDAIRLTAPRLASAPPNAKIWIAGLPWVVRGAYCANCGIPFVYRRTSGRYDLDALDPVGALGALDLALELDPKKKSLRDLVDPGDALELRAGAPWILDLAADPNDWKGARAIDLGTLRRTDGFRFYAGLPGVLLLPAMRTKAGGRLIARIEGDFPAPPPGPRNSWIRCTARGGAGIERRPIPNDREFALPEGAEAFRIDITVPHLERMLIRRITVRAAE
jgi:hypothetical protein